MRTSHLQYLTMIEFMERNGDLSKPSGGPRGRHFIQMKWKELADKLNSDGTGDSRSEEKWRKIEESTQSPHTQPDENQEVDEYILPGKTAVTDADWNTPGTSSQPTVIAPPLRREVITSPPPTHETTIISEEHWAPPLKKKKNESVAKLFVESDRNAREYARERDLAFERLETERLRIHEYELRERVRQRDQELHLQAQWLEFMKEAMNVIVKYFERESTK